MNLRIYYNRDRDNKKTYVFTGGDEATREFLLAERLKKIPHHPVDRVYAESLPQAMEMAGYSPTLGESRVVVLRECPDPLELECMMPALQQLKWLRLVLTSPRLKVDTRFNWPQWVVHKGGVWVQLKSMYGAEELQRMLESRYKSWGPDVCKVVVEHSLSSPAAVLANAKMVEAIADHPTAKAAGVVLRGGQSDVFAFVDAFMNKNIQRAVGLQVNPAAAMGAIYYRIGQVYRLISYRNRGVCGGREWDILTTKMLIPPFLCDSIMQMARYWSAEELVSLLARMTELSMRARTDADGVLELLLLLAR